jgi:hypothetical protein
MVREERKGGDSIGGEGIGQDMVREERKGGDRIW